MKDYYDYWRFLSNAHWTPPLGAQRRVVCAANLYWDGYVALGARHGDDWMRHSAKMRDDYREAHNAMTVDAIGKRPISGFIDQYGRFMDRHEAWRVANEAGQIIRRCGGDDADGGTLYSENLY